MLLPTMARICYRFNLLPGSPFPHEQLKKWIPNCKSPQERCLVLEFYASKDNGRISVVSCPGKFQVVRFDIHKNGGRGRFQSDMKQMNDLLIETGGYSLQECRVYFSSCCDDLIPDAITMFSNASSARSEERLVLVLSERDGAVDPTVALNIVQNWRNIAGTSEATIRFYPNDTSRHRFVLEAILATPNVEIVVSTTHSTSAMDAETLRLLSSRLSSLTSTVRSLDLESVSSDAESDRELASMLATNKSLSRLAVTFDSDNWVATEMSRAVRGVNCTLGEVSFRPRYDERTTEIYFYTALNRNGRRFMRSMTSGPQKIPELLARAGREEDSNFGIYVYPLLRENPAKWVSYLSH